MGKGGDWRRTIQDMTVMNPEEVYLSNLLYCSLLERVVKHRFTHQFFQLYCTLICLSIFKSLGLLLSAFSYNLCSFQMHRLNKLLKKDMKASRIARRGARVT